jgi:hypothetical protein
VLHIENSSGEFRRWPRFAGLNCAACPARGALAANFDNFKFFYELIITQIRKFYNKKFSDLAANSFMKTYNKKNRKEKGPARGCPRRAYGRERGEV